jgi:hypothetical protein
MMTVTAGSSQKGNSAKRIALSKCDRELDSYTVSNLLNYITQKATRTNAYTKRIFNSLGQNAR